MPWAFAAMADLRPVLSVDFDGVIHSYTSGWRGVSVLPDPPVPGAMAFLREAVKVFDVQVFSCRSRSTIGVGDLQELLAFKPWNKREALLP